MLGQNASSPCTIRYTGPGRRYLSYPKAQPGDKYKDDSLLVAATRIEEVEGLHKVNPVRS
jgi:hypothetical protein